MEKSNNQTEIKLQDNTADSGLDDQSFFYAQEQTTENIPKIPTEFIMQRMLRWE